MRARRTTVRTRCFGQGSRVRVACALSRIDRWLPNALEYRVDCFDHSLPFAGLPERSSSHDRKWRLPIRRPNCTCVVSRRISSSLGTRRYGLWPESLRSAHLDHSIGGAGVDEPS